MFDHNSYARLPARAWNTVTSYQSYAMAYYVDRLFKPVQAAAIVGNIAQESGFNPDAIRVNDGGPGINSYGICQWNRQRYANLVAFMVATVGNSPTQQAKFYGQLAYVVHELFTTETAARMILEDDEPQDETLAGVFGQKYEGFGDASVPARNAYAKTALASYNPADADNLWGAHG